MRPSPSAPTGRRSPTAGPDGTVRLWDARDAGSSARLLRGGKGFVLGVAFSPDGRTLASVQLDAPCGSGTSARAGSSGRRSAATPARSARSRSAPTAARSPPRASTATVRLWDVAHAPASSARRCAATRRRSSRASPSARTAGRSPPAATTARCGSGTSGTHRELGASAPRPYRTGGRRRLQPRRAHARLRRRRRRRSRLWDVRHAAASSASRLARPQGPSTASPSARTGGRSPPPASTAPSGSGTSAVAAQLGQPLRGHDGAVARSPFSPDGRTLASGGATTATLRLWDVQHAPGARPAARAAGRVPRLGLAFSPDGARSRAGRRRRGAAWDVRTHRQLGRPLRGQPGTAVGASPSAPTGARSPRRRRRTVQLWDVRTRRPLGGRSAPTTGAVDGVAFSPDGRTLAAAGSDGTVRLWDVRTRRPLGSPLRGHTGVVDGVAFSPDGRTLASASADGTVRLWDVRSRRPLGQLRAAHRPGRGRRVQPGRADARLREQRRDGSALGRPATVSRSGSLCRGHSGFVAAVAFSPRTADARLRAARTGRCGFGEASSGKATRTCATQVCSLVAGSLTREEWSRIAPGLPYRTTCPRLSPPQADPAPADNRNEMVTWLVGAGLIAAALLLLAWAFPRLPRRR